MRKRTLRLGIYCIIAAVVAITATTFFHSAVAEWLGLSWNAESKVIYHGLFWGGLFGGFGVVVAVAGLLAGDPHGTEFSERLAPHLIVLGAVIFIFILLLFASFRTPDSPILRPGETMTI
ncbi:hypothetical protein [Geobacter pickeringii]|uniref:Uncharacterized protein n=1 Tax=Geobacter pickeringii TaxID=345632 RepID=A0A0B5BFH8_9BACT|nr:hypothetical protein [Geobacter pickeringii]AJE03285.1 hypothetical protein GPICK_07910 [Geobacter pickeringii]